VRDQPGRIRTATVTLIQKLEETDEPLPKQLVLRRQG
jgi:hypothetical protein